MVKIPKYILKSRKRGSGLNRKQRRELSRTLPKLQAAVRSHIVRTSPTPIDNILPPSKKTRIRRGRRGRRKRYHDSFPTLFQPINPYIPVLQPIHVSIPTVQPPAMDSEKGTIIIDGPNEKTYELYIDADGLVTVVKETNSQDQIEGTNA